MLSQRIQIQIKSLFGVIKSQFVLISLVNNDKFQDQKLSEQQDSLLWQHKNVRFVRHNKLFVESDQ